MSLEAIKYTRGELQILDQLKLPHESVYVDIKTSKDGYFAILNMVVRGAPAIAIVAALSLAVQLDGIKNNLGEYSRESIQKYIEGELDYLNGSRPTAVNLSDAVGKLKGAVAVEALRDGSTTESIVEVYLERAEHMLLQDVADNKSIGAYGSEWLLKVYAGKPKISVLTHCNTG